jgi:PAS domain S-box-containing protein
MRVAFLCGENSIRSQMAEAFLRHRSGEDVEVESAGVVKGEVHPLTREVMEEVGVDISEQRSKQIEELSPAPFDLVVTLCTPAMDYCGSALSSAEIERNSLFVGVPAFLHWEIPDPVAHEGDRERSLASFRSTRNLVRDHVDVLQGHGYLAALGCQREETENLLDSLAEGIVIHDENRKIYVFNRAAEKITGYSRDEILGRDCHKVFPPDGFCGGECRFGELEKAPPDRGEGWTVPFRTRSGEDRRLRVTVTPQLLGPGRSPGVMASIRDVTEVSELRWTLGRRKSFHGIVGRSRAMREVFETIRQVSTSDYPVLITGGSGTGKELVAMAVHNESRRKGGPFVPINCGALPENILESELFGHVRGAFTGAIRDKKGRFELAHKGTILFDEVGELSPSFQVKLLRVLQEKKFEMVGSERTVSVDVRVVSATNRNLREMVEKGEFREDLFYRLSVVPVFLPPLCERREDIPLLVESILGDVRKETGREVLTVSGETLDCLVSHAWPGNIRELINALQYAAVRSGGEILEPVHLPPEIRCADLPGAGSGLGSGTRGAGSGRGRKLDAESVAQALREAGGNKVRAAKLLGVGRATLYRFLKDHPVS